MDAAQGHAIDDWSRCAATVLATVISKPTGKDELGMSCLNHREHIIADYSGIIANSAFL